MASYLASLPSVADFFPPTPAASKILTNTFRLVPLLGLLLWTPLGGLQAMGKTSTTSRFNLPGRYAWTIAESVGPVNMMFILFRLPSKLYPQSNSPTSFLGTGLPAQNEILGALYVFHYINRAGITPLFLAPSMSPIHLIVAVMMATFQFLNSSNIACWLTYSNVGAEANPEPLISPLSLLGMFMFFASWTSNVLAENALFSMRRGAAKRKAKSEGKAQITYDKVYVVPPAEGWFKNILFPHYVLEWLEWTGYWVLGGAWGLGWGFDSPAFWFLLAEIVTMLPRAVTGRRWYEGKFGKRAVAGRAGAIPLLGL